MENYSSEQVKRFFEAISDWRGSYRTIRLNYLAVREGDKLLVLSARIIMAVHLSKELLSIFQAGNIQCGQWDINTSDKSVEQVIEGLTSSEGLNILGHGILSLPSYPDRDISISTPILLHHEGLKNGNRLAILTLSGSNTYPYLVQPETDWKLKAGTVPYDTLEELKSEYGLAGNPNSDYASLEVIALTAVEVLATSTITGAKAKLGIWAAKGLDISKIQLGFRVFEKDQVVLRGAIKGDQLDWQPVGEELGGIAELNVIPGSFIQCIASYNGLAHDVKWHADPSFLPNSRATVLSIVDPNRTLLQSFLFPEKPYKGKPQDDFEMAIGWLFWGLGFASLNLGTNPKTKDAFDTVLMTPNGDFAVIECTLELLRNESKLSKLASRAAKLRDALDASHHNRIRLLPIIISSLPKEQLIADIEQAEKLGILVLTKENIEWALAEITRFPNANKLYEDGIQTIQNKINQQDLFKRT